MKMFLVSKNKKWNYYVYLIVRLITIGDFKSVIKMNNKLYKVDNQRLFMTEKDAQDYIKEIGVIQ